MPLEVTKGRLLDVGKPAGADVSGADAAVGDVKAVKTFFSVAPPIKTGTMPTVAIASGSNTYSAGYHAGNVGGLSAIEATLAVGNIKTGINIFGFAGTVIPGGTETIEKYADATIVAGATYTPAASGIFLNVGYQAFTNQYYSTLAALWYSPAGMIRHRGASAIGDGTNFRIMNHLGADAEYCLMRHYYSTGTYTREMDLFLAFGATWTPATSGFFANGSPTVDPHLEIQFTTAGWRSVDESSANYIPVTIAIGDGTNLRVRNSGLAANNVTMRAKLT